MLLTHAAAGNVSRQKSGCCFGRGQTVVVVVEVVVVVVVVVKNRDWDPSQVLGLVVLLTFIQFLALETFCSPSYGQTRVENTYV